MNINVVRNNIAFDDLLKIFVNFTKDFSYYKKVNLISNFIVKGEKIYFKNDYVYTPVYKNSFIDRIYKMRHLYTADLVVNPDNYTNTVDIVFTDGSYSYILGYSSYNTSYYTTSSYIGSYTYSYSTSYNSSYVTSFASSYNSYISSYVYSSYTPFSSSVSSYNTSFINYPIINLQIYKSFESPVYKNKYQYEACNIEQNFFITGYGLELI